MITPSDNERDEYESDEMEIFKVEMELTRSFQCGGTAPTRLLPRSGSTREGGILKSNKMIELATRIFW